MNVKVSVDASRAVTSGANFDWRSARFNRSAINIDDGSAVYDEPAYCGSTSRDARMFPPERRAVAAGVVHVDDAEAEALDHLRQHQAGAIHRVGEGEEQRQVVGAGPAFVRHQHQERFGGTPAGEVVIKLDLGDAGIGFLVYGGSMLIVALIAPRGMGMGDVKLAGLIGLVLGALGIRFVGVAAGLGVLIGGVVAVVALFFGATRKTGIPYGPSMAVGAVLSLFAGSEIADLYLRLLGA